METQKKNEVIVIGELNVDIILNKMLQFPLVGKEILAGNLDVTLGSSSAIFASNLRTLGTPVGFIGKLGKDAFADTVLKSLTAKAVDVTQIKQSNHLQTGATIVLNYGQERAMITYAGAMEEMGLNDIDFKNFTSAKHLHISSIFLQKKILNNLPFILSKSRAMGLTISIDPQWDPCEKWEINLPPILSNLDIFLPNMQEFLLITGKQTLEEGIESIKKIAPQILLVIKDGANGAYAWKDGQLTHQPAFLNKRVVDCIGSGDSFNAGFMHAFLKGSSLAHSMEYGSLMGAISTTKPGGTAAFENRETVNKIAEEQFGITINDKQATYEA
jgi:sugar/nucleoside kinase (ribokinase family)